MRFIFFIVILFIISTSNFAQSSTEILKKDSIGLVPLPHDLFPIKFVAVNYQLYFPKVAIQEGLTEGYVYCSFKIDEDGYLYDIITPTYSDKAFVESAVNYLKGFRAEVVPNQIGFPYSIKVRFKLE